MDLQTVELLALDPLLTKPDATCLRANGISAKKVIKSLSVNHDHYTKDLLVTSSSKELFAVHGFSQSDGKLYLPSSFSVSS